MKKEVKKLFEDFPNLIDLLKKLRQSDEMSYESISNYFNGLGYKCSRKLIERLYKKYKIDSKRTREGNKNSFYNKSHSEETKEKISKNKIAGEKTKGNKNPMFGKKGILSPVWKGGNSSRQVYFYSSPEWASKRFEIMSMDCFTCMLCGETANKKNGFLNVHHIIPLSVDWEQRLENNNLITLCVSCHKNTFGKEQEMISLFQDIVRTHRRL